MSNLVKHWTTITGAEIQPASKRSSTLINKTWPTVSDRNKAIREAMFPYYEQSPVEKVLTGKEHTKWNSKPFQNDFWIFTDMDPEMTMEDSFCQMKCWYLDSYYTNTIERKLMAATAVRHDLDAGRACANASKFGEGIRSPNRVLVKLGPEDFIWERRQEVTYRQLTRQIFEDCQKTGSSISIPQLIGPGACSVPNHLRIEEMVRYVGLNIHQAAGLAETYRVLELDFHSVVTKKIGKSRRTLNGYVKEFVKNNRRAPWEITVTNQGKTLGDIERSLLDLANEPQETPEWMNEPTYQIDNLAAYFIREEEEEEEEEESASELLSESFDDWGSAEDEDEDEDVADTEEELTEEELTEEEHASQFEKSSMLSMLSMDGEQYVSNKVMSINDFEQKNPVREYTYHNISRIPKSQHLVATNRTRFIKVLEKLKDFGLSVQQTQVASAWVEKKGTLSQKSEWRQAKIHVENIRARQKYNALKNKIKIIKTKTAASAA